MQEKRLEKKILITNKLGLHARAAAKFVSLTSKCESRFVVKKGKNIVSGSSLLGLMTLAASKGTEIKVQCIGNRAEQDLEKLIDLIKNNFGEEKPLSENIRKQKIIKGIGVSSGYAIGNCVLKKTLNLSHSEYNISISNVKNELIRLDKAVKKTILDFKKIINKIQSTKNDVYEEMKLVLEANIYLLSSSSFIKDAKKRISNDLINAEFAINEELNKQFKIFNRIKDDYLKDRFDDVRDVCKRILDNLQKKNFSSKVKANQILVANELGPADLFSETKNKYIGLVSGLGGPEGHFAIVARSLSIPTIVGVKNVLKKLRKNDELIIDGEKGILITNPTEETRLFYKKKIEEKKSQEKKLDSFANTMPKTSDGKKISIEANVDNEEEVKESMRKGINGIGLYRSEYLFMNKKRMPSEQEQFISIRNALKYLKGNPLTIRTLDVGNDKKVPSIDKFLSKSPNPALGLRAIRLTLAYPKIFKKQLAAILRASLSESMPLEGLFKRSMSTFLILGGKLATVNAAS